MFDFRTSAVRDDEVFVTASLPLKTVIFGAAKRIFDILVSFTFLVPLLIAVSLVLVCLNPFFNQGPLLFAQVRMGRNCKPFVAYKFRSMVPADRVTRGANDPLEVDRITRLGHIIRKLRIDELPQAINVLRGDMSLIGPRPDYVHHARRFLRTVPGYRARHSVRPGISGLAQTEVGYVAGSEATRQKVQADLYYIRNSGFLLEAWVIWRTFIVIASRRGS
ncbi:MAG: sugar transferase [Rhodobacteraceae bacterium]|nr:sugar transferase [Paracoccaceae bacterium]